MKFKEVTYEEMMNQLYAHGENNPIEARVIFKKGVCSEIYDVNIQTRTFTFSSASKMFNNKCGRSVFAECMGYKGTFYRLVRIEDTLSNENYVALCYLEDK